MGFETARKPASSPPRRPARPPSASWLLSTEFGRSRWGGWVDGWRRRKKRIGRGAGKPASASLSLFHLCPPLSYPLLLGGGDGWMRRQRGACRICASLSLGSRAAHSLTSRSLPSVLEEEGDRRPSSAAVKAGQGREGEGGRERETETGSAQETVVVLRKETAAARRRRRPRGEAGVGGRRSQKGQ